VNNGLYDAEAPLSQSPILNAQNPWQKLNEVQVNGVGSPTITFEQIPQGFRNLYLTGQVRVSNAAEAGVLAARFNYDAGANYDQIADDNFNSALSASPSAGATSATIGRVLAASATAGRAGVFECTIFNYASPYWQKVMSTWCGYYDGGVGNQLFLSNEAWRSTLPITVIQLIETSGNNFVNGSVVSLYGLL